MQGSGSRGASPREFTPALWDPIHHLGTEFAQGPLATIQNKMLEGMNILTEICGAPRVSPSDPELSAFLFGLANYLVDGSPLPTGRGRLFLQSVAASLYHAGRKGNDADPRSFYAHLLNRCTEYVQIYQRAHGERRPLYIVKRFLAGYGLGDPEDLDLAVSLRELIHPELERGVQLLAAAAEADLRRIRPSGERSFRLGRGELRLL